MSGQKTIKRISRPCQLTSHTKPRRRRWVVENPPLIIGKIVNSHIRTKANAVRFEQKLYLK